jgi:hypothetical protein
VNQFLWWKCLDWNEIFLVEVGLRAQNTIWNFKVPCDIISNTFKVIFFSSCCLSFTALESFCHNYMKKTFITSAVKIIIPFMILGARPTSTPGSRRDQLVVVQSVDTVRRCTTSYLLPGPACLWCIVYCSSRKKTPPYGAFQVHIRVLTLRIWLFTNTRCFMSITLLDFWNPLSPINFHITMQSNSLDLGGWLCDPSTPLGPTLRIFGVANWAQVTNKC